MEGKQKSKIRMERREFLTTELALKYNSNKEVLQGSLSKGIKGLKLSSSCKEGCLWEEEESEMRELCVWVQLRANKKQSVW